jgi:hypothetical protein
MIYVPRGFKADVIIYKKWDHPFLNILSYGYNKSSKYMMWHSIGKTFNWNNIKQLSSFTYMLQV